MKEVQQSFVVSSDDPLYKEYVSRFIANGYGLVNGIDLKSIMYILPDEVLRIVISDEQKLILLQTGTTLLNKNDRLHFRPDDGKLHVIYQNLNKYDNRGTEILTSECQFYNPSRSILYLNTGRNDYQDCIRQCRSKQMDLSVPEIEFSISTFLPDVIISNNISLDAKLKLVRTGILKLPDERILIANFDTGKLYISKDFVKDRPNKSSNRFRLVKRSEVKFTWELKSEQKKIFQLTVARKVSNDKENQLIP
ncbi:hypothetical protein [Chitinophaga rhizophila]|uniref:Uncharacterized protein n=1 Tax=Chitinophaga rhizophila TaxID=2866212 RepID=A0ABS7G9P4_9BACT|nr:hypothetical protein [Chitinophaga rhizophila]MBW8683432.1 hypothetical protein [Chitinophaga rhizophila]